MNNPTPLLTFALLVPVLAAQQPTSRPSDVAAKPAAILTAVLEATDETRQDALVAFLEDQIASNAIYAGQYDGLLPVVDDTLPLLTEWIIDTPNEIFRQEQFRTACIRAVRDLVTGDAPQEIMKRLETVATDEFEEGGLRDTAAFALAQFGNKTFVDDRVAAATKMTKSPNLDQQGQGWQQLADIHYNTRSYEDAVKAYQKLLGLMEQAGPQPGMATQYYNCACSLALSGNTDGAIEYVGKALATGKRTGQQLNRRLLETDRDITSLRGDERFQKLMAEYYGPAGKQPSKDADAGK